MTDQLELERAQVTARGAHAVAAGPKTILVHAQNDGTVDARLEAMSVGLAARVQAQRLHRHDLVPVVNVNLGWTFGGVD